MRDRIIRFECKRFIIVGRTAGTAEIASSEALTHSRAIQRRPSMSTRTALLQRVIARNPLLTGYVLHTLISFQTLPNGCLGKLAISRYAGPTDHFTSRFCIIFS